jgi:hypothetical protein
LALLLARGQELEESAPVLKAGQSVPYRATRDGIRTFSILGPTEVVFSHGRFEIWRTRADYAWDKKTLLRVVVPASYRIVKLLGKGFYFSSGLQIPCEHAFVMRVVTPGEDWRVAVEAVKEQTVLLGNWEGRYKRH